MMALRAQLLFYLPCLPVPVPLYSTERFLLSDTPSPSSLISLPALSRTLELPTGTLMPGSLKAEAQLFL